MSYWTTLAISFLSDFVISAGGAMLTAMVASGQTEVPKPAVMIFAIVTGLVAAGRRVQALLQVPPVPPEPAKP